MHHNIEDVVLQYVQECQAIQQQKQLQIQEYEAAIITKVQEDFNQGLIVNERRYFKDLEKKYQEVEQQIKQEFDEEIDKKATIFADALVNNDLKADQHQLGLTFDSDLIKKIKGIYFGEEVITTSSPVISQELTATFITETQDTLSHLQIDQPTEVIEIKTQDDIKNENIESSEIIKNDEIELLIEEIEELLSA